MNAPLFLSGIALLLVLPGLAWVFYGHRRKKIMENVQWRRLSSLREKHDFLAMSLYKAGAIKSAELLEEIAARTHQVRDRMEKLESWLITHTLESVAKEQARAKLAMEIVKGSGDKGPMRLKWDDFPDFHRQAELISSASKVKAAYGAFVQELVSELDRLAREIVNTGITDDTEIYGTLGGRLQILATFEKCEFMRLLSAAEGFAPSSGG